jgi:hypothetical protein
MTVGEAQLLDAVTDIGPLLDNETKYEAVGQVYVSVPPEFTLVAF